jgi:hypothetical protein
MGCQRSNYEPYLRTIQFLVDKDKFWIGLFAQESLDLLQLEGIAGDENLQVALTALRSLQTSHKIDNTYSPRSHDLIATRSIRSIQPLT